jgi:hypothetical protein
MRENKGRKSGLGEISLSKEKVMAGIRERTRGNGAPLLSHRQTKGAANGHAQPKATAPHSYSTDSGCLRSRSGRVPSLRFERLVPATRPSIRAPPSLAVSRLCAPRVSYPVLAPRDIAGGAVSPLLRPRQAGQKCPRSSSPYRGPSRLPSRQILAHSVLAGADEDRILARFCAAT